MILGLGLDVVEVGRFRRVRQRRGGRFLSRVFTEAELESCLGRADADRHLAARFAAKEAGMKALGTGWAGGIGWRDFEVVSGAGPPRLALHGEAARRAEALGARAAHLSVTHDGGVAAAVVILEG